MTAAPLVEPTIGTRASWRAALDRPAALALGIAVASVAYRVWLLAIDVPPTNSDEATMGLVVGLMIWDDWLILPYVGAAAAVLVAGCGADLLRRRDLMLATMGGVMVGAAPLVVHHLTGR